MIINEFDKKMMDQAHSIVMEFLSNENIDLLCKEDIKPRLIYMREKLSDENKQKLVDHGHMVYDNLSKETYNKCLMDRRQCRIMMNSFYRIGATE